METLRIEIINPNTKKLLKDLADLKLKFKGLLFKLRSVSVPSLDEITREVEMVRTSRYEGKTE
jgi:hypothetical protein